MRFSRSRKLAPRYIGPYPITVRIGSVAYRVTFPASFCGVHDVFHVSSVRKCLKNQEFVLEPQQMEEVEIRPYLTIVQTPGHIVASEIKRLRSKDVPLVKVQWSDVTTQNFSLDLKLYLIRNLIKRNIFQNIYMSY